MIMYLSDAKALSKMEPETKAEFEKYMDALDTESASRGYPYGSGSLWQTTGAECWLGFFEDGYSPSQAFDEDLSYD